MKIEHIEDKKRKHVDTCALLLVERELPYDTMEKLSHIGNCLEDALYMSFASINIKQLCTLITADISIDVSKPFKDCTLFERKYRKMYFMAKQLLAYRAYRFCFMGGAMGETKTFYTDKGYVEVWNMVNKHITENMNGVVRAAYCISIDGEDVGTLNNFYSMFTDKIEGEINSIKADDLSADWKTKS
jgi:hypothetical protein